MNHKIQILAIVSIFTLHVQSSFGMYDYAEIFMHQPDEYDMPMEREYEAKRQEIPKEFEKKLSRRYLHSLPDRADTIIGRRQGCISTLICYGLASCLVASVDLDTHERAHKNGEQKKSP